MNLDYLLTEEFAQNRRIITEAVIAKIAHCDYQAEKRVNDAMAEAYKEEKAPK